MNSKERFNEKIDQMKGEQAKNVKMFTDEEYKLKIERIKEVKMPGHKWLPRDYALVNKFEVLQVLRIVAKLSHSSSLTGLS